MSEPTPFPPANRFTVEWRLFVGGMLLLGAFVSGMLYRERLSIDRQERVRLTTQARVVHASSWGSSMPPAADSTTTFL